MSTSLITPAELALTIAHAKANLFGAVYVQKPLKLRKSMAALAAATFRGTLYKVYSMKGFMTLTDYQKSVNNAKERAGSTPNFIQQERKWGRHLIVKGKSSDMVIEHNGRFYLNIRTTANSRSESRYVDAIGNEYTYEQVEPFLLAGDKRSTKKASREATAERQGLSLQSSVKIFAIPLDTIVTLAYCGTTYQLIAEPQGASAAMVQRIEQENSEVETANP